MISTKLHAYDLSSLNDSWIFSRGHKLELLTLAKCLPRFSATLFELMSEAAPSSAITVAYRALPTDYSKTDHLSYKVGAVSVLRTSLLDSNLHWYSKAKGLVQLRNNLPISL